MKKILSVFFGLAFLAVPVMAQSTLTFHLKDGQQFSYGLDEKPVITYVDNDLVLNTTRTEVRFPLASLSGFTFTDDETGVNTVKKDDSLKPVLNLDNHVISITGAKTGIKVTVTGSDGKVLGTYKTDEEGSVTFSIADLPDGIYIINSENLTCKIMKK